MPMPRYEPTPEDLDIIRRHNNEQAARVLGRNKDTVRKVRLEHGIPNPSGDARAIQPGNAKVPPVEPDEDETAARIPEFAPPIWRIPEHLSFQSGMWLALENVQREMGALEIERDEVDVELPGAEPCMVCWVADLHLGHTDTDMTRLRRDLETIKNTPGMYCILGGDLVDNVVTSVTSRGMSMEQLTPPRIQRALIEEAVAFLGRDKILALVLGNHDAWSRSSVDFDPIAYFAKHAGCEDRYLGAFGYVNIKVGSERYRILAAHQFRMRSSFNKSHQGKRLLEFHGDDAVDVIYTGHTHDSAVESTHIRQKTRFIGQAGTYLRSSRYSKALGYTNSTPEMPGAVLWGDRHKVFGVYDGLVDGPAILSAFRSALRT